ncbi:hypothetical protein SRHO_G00275370 [Serrasalmus rhombeus]
MWVTAECRGGEAKGEPKNLPVIRRQKHPQCQPRSGHLLAHATGQPLSSKLAYGAHEQLADETGSGTALGGRACRPTLGLGGREL